MGKSKILVQTVTPVMRRLNEKIKALGLRRDVFLNTVFQEEVKYMASELSGKCNSATAREFLSSKLRALPTMPVGIMLDKDVIAAIDANCTKTNTPRDCFVNRVFFFLAAEKKNLDAVQISITNIIRSTVDNLGVNALDNAAMFISSPFHELRLFMEENGSSFYEWPFPEKWAGFDCYLEDSSVLGSKEYMSLEDLLSDK